MLPKIYRSEPEKQEVFLRLDKRYPFPSSVIAWLCDENGERRIGGNLVLAEDGKRPAGVCDELACLAGLKLDAEGRWDKDQCIETLAAEIARLQEAK